MSGTNYFRLIEAYFDGNLSAVDKLMLENQLVKDPLVKAEFDLQKYVNQGLMTVRQQQIKARLSAINVTPVSVNLVQSSAIKWLAGTVAAATLLGGILYWISGDNNPIIPLDMRQMTSNNFEISLETVLNSPNPKAIADKGEVTLNITKVVAKKEIILLAEQRITQKSKNITPQEPNAIAIKPQALLSFEDENLFVNTTGIDLEQMKPITIKTAQVKETSIEVLLPQQINKFHYQYFSNKLFLYGNFDEEPYEIIELKQKGDRKLFLSYKNSVYIIEADKIDITEMQTLNDEKLLNELEMISTSK